MWASWCSMKSGRKPSTSSRMVRAAGLALMSSVEKEADLGALLHGALMPSTGRESVREMEGRNTLAFRVGQDRGLPCKLQGSW